MKRVLWICLALCCVAAAGWWLWTLRPVPPPKLETIRLTLLDEQHVRVEAQGSPRLEIVFAPESDKHAVDSLCSLNHFISDSIPEEKRMWVVGYFNGSYSPTISYGRILPWESIKNFKIVRELRIYDGPYPYFVLKGWYVDPPFDYINYDETPPRAILHRTDLLPSDFDPPLPAGELIHRGDKYGVGDF